MESNRKLYAGIGSRSTPFDVLADMESFAFIASKKGWILRSGHAAGADSAFEIGCDNANGKKEIFLPWLGFRNNYVSEFCQPTSEAHSLAESIHPAYNYLSYGAKNLVARNMHQILGYDLKTPVEFIICYTPNGQESKIEYDHRSGGTGSAIALASSCNIPVFNLYNKNRYLDVIELLISYGN
ncbi:MAG: hypothetical protein ACXW2E_01915 [Nitrososphaeraceae archaeon]